MKAKVIFSLFFIAALGYLTAQEEQVTIDRNEQKLVIDSVVSILEKNYVYPETAMKMNDLIIKNLNDGKYEDLTDPSDFSNRLTNDLVSVSNDKHLGVVFAPRTIAMMRKSLENPDEDAYHEFLKKEYRKKNYMFEELKILEGNIGYLKFNQFVSTTTFPEAGETAVAAMQFLANTDAIIFDLRGNGGGSPDMIQLLTSYLFEGETQHLNSFYWRPDDETIQFWTLTYVPGKKIPDVPVFVLTSNRTFSGAEEFTYNLKNMKRGIIVGEVTGGGAHPVDRKIINDHFAISVPMGKAINPVTKTNWEGIGIMPHYEVPADQALDRAVVLALDTLITKETDEESRNGLVWVKERKQALLNPQKLDEKEMKKFTGHYGPRKITLDGEQLYYQREDRPKMRMIPMNRDTFVFEELDYFKLHFIEENGKVTVVQGMYNDGRTDQNERDK